MAALKEGLEAFQKYVTACFRELLDRPDLLCISWVQKLLDSLVLIMGKFNSLISDNRSYLKEIEMKQLIWLHKLRCDKALMVIKATLDGLIFIRHSKASLEVFCSVLDVKKFDTILSARASLDEFMEIMNHEKESNKAIQRFRIEGRLGLHPYRLFTWHTEEEFSVARELFLFGKHFVTPTQVQIAKTGGLAHALFSMGYVIFFATWALAAAIPCRDREASGAVFRRNSVYRYTWFSPLILLRDKIDIVGKRADKVNCSGLLSELCDMEMHAKDLNEMIVRLKDPLTEEEKAELSRRVEELKGVLATMNDRLYPSRRMSNSFDAHLKKVSSTIGVFRADVAHWKDNPLGTDSCDADVKYWKKFFAE
ncbi:protein BYPASS1-LIKE-like isoform X1 [Cornus florida]|uniref:protein BYPASS1-LIKE-like isoform X1 n=2 Tax=Cornus florida TaxID=4283 RepID=UPI00289EC740|nr:protein BYPASS1-LIKE-like isoform X1 [Cornus florida]